jgi:hypothetical protein
MLLVSDELNLVVKVSLDKDLALRLAEQLQRLAATGNRELLSLRLARGMRQVLRSALDTDLHEPDPDDLKLAEELAKVHGVSFPTQARQSAGALEAFLLSIPDQPAHRQSRPGRDLTHVFGPPNPDRTKST